MIDKIMKIAVPTIAIWVAKKIKDSYDESKGKSHDEGYSKGRSEGYDEGKKAGKNAPHFEDFRFDTRGLDSKIDSNLWCEKIIQSLNNQEHIDEKTRAKRYGMDCTPRQSGFPFVVTCFPRLDRICLPKIYNDTSYLLKLDMCYKLLRDEYLLGLNEGLESSVVCEIKGLMDSWYLVQRERYLRACIVDEGAYSTDLSLLNLTKLEDKIRGICEKYTESMRDDKAKLEEYVSESFGVFDGVQADLEDLEELNSYYPKNKKDLTLQKYAWLEIMLEFWFNSDDYKESELYKQVRESCCEQWCQDSKEADSTEHTATKE